MPDIQEHALSDDEIRKALGKGTVIQTVNDVNQQGFRFDKKGRMVLFQPITPEMGHWQGVIRRQDKIEFFDSYGDSPDAIVDHLSGQEREAMGEFPGEVSAALAKLGLPVFKNVYDFQKERRNVNTCGRHVICRLLFSGLTLPQYAQLIKRSKLSPDDFVSAIVFQLLGR